MNEKVVAWVLDFLTDGQQFVNMGVKQNLLQPILEPHRDALFYMLSLPFMQMIVVALLNPFH